MEKIKPKEELNSLEIRLVLLGLQNLRGAQVQRIYQPTVNEFNLYLYDGESEKMLAISSNAIYLSERKRENPKRPSQFCMFLRKHLLNSRIMDFKQVNGDRIIKIVFARGEERKHVYLEVFRKGNIILTDDKDKIVHALRFQNFGGRDIRTNKFYIPPRPKINIQNISDNEFDNILLLNRKKDAVKVLASDFGLGGDYAEEIFLRAGVDKNKECSRLTNAEKIELYKHLKKITSAFPETPICVYQYGRPVNTLPFKFKSYETLETKKFDTFNKAIDYYFSFQGKQRKINDTPKENPQVERLRAILDNQKLSLSEFERKSRESKEIAEKMKNNIYIIQNVLRGIRNALESMSWKELDLILSSEKQKGVREAEMIKQLIPEESSVVIDLPPEVQININSSVAETMEGFFEHAKRYEDKAESARTSIKETEEKISKIIKKAKRAEIEKKKIPDVRLAKDTWYKQYRWFFTSAGNLVIAGKDAGSNERLINKRMRADDFVFHADMSGSPFGLLRNGSTSANIEQKEAAIFVASYSRAWKMGYGAVDVYYIRPVQLKKSQSGEYVPRGSFVIKGKKEYLKNIKLELSIGIKIDKKENYLEIEVISGPSSAVKKHAQASVTIIPGGSGEKEIAGKILEFLKNRLRDEYKHVMSKIGIDDIQRLIPGNSRIFV